LTVRGAGLSLSKTNKAAFRQDKYEELFMQKDADIKLAICSGSFHNDLVDRRISLSELLELAAAFKFDAVEIREDLLTDKAREPLVLKRLARESGLSLIYSSLDRVVGKSLEKTIENAALIRKRVDEAALLGCSIYKTGFGETNEYSDITDDHQRYIAELGHYAHEKNVLICLENSDAETGNRPGLFSSFFTCGKYSGFGMTFDCGNFLKVGYNPLEAVSQLQKHISYFHLKDIILDDKTSTYLGHGDLEIIPLISMIAGIGYKGYLCFEFPMSIDNMDEIRSSLDLVNGLVKAGR
jgi:sugar phosphate isomerase/epimerase